MGLEEQPDEGDNGVHASASPFEGLAERTNWLGRKPEEDAFGRALLDAGIPRDRIDSWSLDPQIRIDGDDDNEGKSKKGSVFDVLEELDADDCLHEIVRLNEIN